jgi:hypothetical protein
MLGQNFFDGFDTSLDRCFIARRAVLPQQILKDVGWHDGIALDGFHQILADKQAGKMLVNLRIQ